MAEQGKILIRTLPVQPTLKKRSKTTKEEEKLKSKTHIPACNDQSCDSVANLYPPPSRSIERSSVWLLV